ncbi:PorV/PorQ family protein [Salisaeta longa]|uniref:PorV/PorQ family protein n=1 Tax=Salisaeta longa TaxID=503170 RepID=UPI0003B72050|nr:PorV/PorQ family protein [Salisaeta longa]
MISFRSVCLWAAGAAFVLLGLVPPAAAQAVGPGAFARLGFGARGMALGNAQTADVSGDVSAYYNPALAAYATGQHVQLSAALMTFDRSLQFAAFQTPLGPTAGLEVGVIHAGVSTIDARNADGFRTGTLSTDEYNLFLAFGNRFSEQFAAGVALNLYQANYYDVTDASVGFGVDLGATYRATPQLTVALAANDILATYNWDTGAVGGQSSSDRFPVRVRVGSHYTIADGRFRVMAEYETRIVERERRVRVVRQGGGRLVNQFTTETVRRYDQRARLGVAYRPLQKMTLRAGADRISDDGMDGMRPTAGFGIRHTLGTLKLRVGYAFMLEPFVRDPLHVLTVNLFL